MQTRISPLIEAAAAERRAVRLLFVCTGNICRSPLAQAVFDLAAEQKSVSRFFLTESAGITGYHVGENADPRMRTCARRHGVVLDHQARLFRVEDFEYFDLILAMDAGHRSWLQAKTPMASQRAKIILFRDFQPGVRRSGLEVPDPYYGDAEAFEGVFRIVETCAAGLLDDILQAMRKFAPPA